MAIRTEKKKPVRDEMKKIYTGKTRNAPTMSSIKMATGLHDNKQLMTICF